MAALWLSLLTVGWTGSVVYAVENRPGMDHYLDGLEAYDRGAYDEALADFSKAIEKDGNNMEYQYRFGLTYSKLGKDLEASSIFRAVIAKDKARYGAAYFDLADIHTRKKDYAAALKVLDEAEKNVEDTARVYMEKGVVCLKMKDTACAEDNFRKALALKPELAQSAYYHLGLVYLEKNDSAAAKGMFKQAIDVDPKTDIAAAARSAMENTGAMRRAAKPWHVIADLSYAYDDNIPNDPLDAPGFSADPATDLGDQYQALGLNAYYSFSFSSNLGLDVGYALSYLRYNDSDNGNILGNSPYLLLKHSGKSWAADLRYTYSYYTEDGDKKLSQNALVPTIRVDEPYGMQSSISLGYIDKDYLDDGVTPDASHMFVKARQMFKIPGREIRPFLGMGYGDEDADTDEATYTYFEFMAGVSFLLPYSIYADLSYTDLRSDYDVVYGAGKREDKGYLIFTQLSKNVYDGVIARLSYLYVKNNSNVMTSGLTPNYDPYEYDKNIVKFQVEVSL
jgi:tetratricopeptide (TPR) repeat protein